MQQYIPGDRVWVAQADGTYWPAIVVTDDVALENSGLHRPSEKDFSVLYYGPEPCIGFEDIRDLSAFENSSERAVTTDAALRQAIQEASEDPAANPLKLDGYVSQAAAGLGSKAAKQPSHKATRESAGDDADANDRKKLRKDAGAKHGAAGMSSRGDDDAVVASGHRYEDVRTLKDIAGRLDKANADSDLRGALKQLLRLDRVMVTYEQLLASGVGRSVGNLKGNAAMKTLWALVDQLVLSMMKHALPVETLEAVQYLREVSRTESANAESAKEAMMLIAAENAETGSGRYKTPVDRITEAFVELEADAIAALPSSFRIEAFVQELFSKLGTEQRRKLLEVIVKPGHRDLRRRLLNGTLDATGFSRLSAEELITNEEKEKEHQKIAAVIAEQESQAAADAVGTDMFPCPNCAKRNARYHEQQTRGADEPTTKFCYCLECKHNWTTE